MNPIPFIDKIVSVTSEMINRAFGFPMHCVVVAILLMAKTVPFSGETVNRAFGFPIRCIMTAILLMAKTILLSGEMVNPCKKSRATGYARRFRLMLAFRLLVSKLPPSYS
jgi:hypothetical protein